MESSKQQIELARLNEEVHRRQEAIAETSPEPLSIAVAKQLKIIESRPAATDEELAAREETIEEFRAKEKARERNERMATFIQDRGSRYQSCTLGGFDVEGSEAKADAVARLREYGKNFTTMTSEGIGIILYGPKGTGKDHLMVAMVRGAIGLGYRVIWRNCVDLYAEFRDGIRDDTKELRLIHQLAYPDILYLSDPLPPIGALTEFQASKLFSILDYRYSRHKPTWVTVNVASGVEFDQRLGAQNADRLKDGALAIHCNWPSYRKVQS